MSFKNDHEGTSLEKTYEFFSYHLGSVNTPFSFSSNLHVSIIGCGGTGANVAFCLASSGITRFSLIDFDKVQSSNLNRQFAYDNRDIGKSKVICLKSKLHQINSELRISIFEKKSLVLTI